VSVYVCVSDVDLLKEHYAACEGWLSSLVAQYNRTGVKNFYNEYGDWVPPQEYPRCDASYTAVYGFMHNMAYFVNISRVVGNADNVAKYSALYTQVGKEMHSTWFHADTNLYAGGGQGCNVMALSLDGMVPAELRPKVFATLVADIAAAKMHLTTGILSTAQLFGVLSAGGQHDLALRIATQTTYPSYGYMFNNLHENATTLWELWYAPDAGIGMNSRNHIMSARKAHTHTHRIDMPFKNMALISLFSLSALILSGSAASAAGSGASLLASSWTARTTAPSAWSRASRW